MDGQLVWIVALLLYVYDSVSLENHAAVLRYSIDGVTAKITTPTFTVGGRRIFVPNPLRPDHCDLLLDPQNSKKLSSLDRYFIRRASPFYFIHQVVAVGAFLVLFVLTPILAMHMNLLRACLISVGITFWLCLIHWLEMWFNRRLLGVDVSAIRADFLHVLLCPPNAVNCARRIAALRQSRYGVLPCLRAFSPYDAEKYVEQFQPSGASS
jgi:hypothetical protein